MGNSQGGYVGSAIVKFQINGFKNFGKKGFDKHAKHWDVSEMEGNIKDKICIVTGANAGLGYEVSLALAKKQAHVIMICRSKERGETAHKEVIEKSGNKNVELAILDMSIAGEVRNFCTIFNEQERPLYCLVNNVGVLYNDRSETSEKIESSFATNTLSTFLMTEYLIPALKRSKPSRVINVCSGGLYTVKMDDDYQNSKGKYDGLKAYSMTKRHQLYLTELWAEKFSKENEEIGFFACHPGWSRTPGTKSSLPKWFDNLNLRTAEEGADTLIWLSIAEKLKDSKYNGKFYFDRDFAPTDMTTSTASSREDKDKMYKYFVDLRQQLEDGKIVVEEKKEEEKKH